MVDLVGERFENIVKKKVEVPRPTSPVFDGFYVDINSGWWGCWLIGDELYVVPGQNVWWPTSRSCSWLNFWEAARICQQLLQ